MITVGDLIFKQKIEKYLDYVINGEKLLIIDGNGNEIIMLKNEKGENKK